MPDNRNSYDNRSGFSEKKPEEISPGELKSFYSDEEKKIVSRNLFDKKAEEIAKTFVVEKDKQYRVSMSQIRRLYDEIKRLDQNLYVAPEAWQKLEPYIRMVRSKVAYNVARAIEKKDSEKAVYKNLSTFIRNGIGLVKDKEDFHVFAALFEAVYGFYYEINGNYKKSEEL